MVWITAIEQAKAGLAGLRDLTDDGFEMIFGVMSTCSDDHQILDQFGQVELVSLLRIKDRRQVVDTVSI